MHIQLASVDMSDGPLSENRKLSAVSPSSSHAQNFAAHHLASFLRKQQR